jgi:hypothetical protein
MNDVSLSFLDTESAHLAQAGGEEQSQVNPNGIVDALARAANEDTGIVVVVGWHELAAALLDGDPVLARKAVVWAMRAGDVRPAAQILQFCPGLLARIKVAIVHDGNDLIRLIAVLPKVAWTLACLVDDPEMGTLIQRLRTQELIGYYSLPDRRIRDLSHLVRRGARLTGGIRADWWKDRCAGTTALCIAAGPSLGRHMPLIRQLAERCLVVAVDVIQARLHAAGIRIDFVVHLDTNKHVSNRVKMPPSDDCVLVMPLDGHADSDGDWKRVVYTGDGGMAAAFLGSGNHQYPSGTNVGASSVGWAYHLGCTDIILAGHDLALDGERYYCDLVDGREAMETAGVRITVADGNLRVPGNGGVEVRTTAAFKNGISDLTLMCSRFARDGRGIFNLNAGTTVGALIAGARILPEGYEPAQARPILDIDAAPRIGHVSGDSTSIAEHCRKAITAYVAAWKAHPQAGESPLAPFIELSVDPQHALGHQIMAPFQMAHVLQGYRAACMPATSGRRTALQDAARALATVQAAVLPLLDSVLESGTYPQAAAAYWMRRGPEHAFFRRLRSMVPGQPRGSLDEVIVPLISRDMRSLSRLLPDTPVHCVVHIGDLVRFTASAADCVHPTLVGDLFAALRLPACSDLSYVATMAAETGFHALDAPPPPAWSASVGFTAVAAFERLRSGSSADIAGDAATACAWRHVRQLTVEWLFEHDHEAVLADLIGQRILPVDDGLADHVLSRHRTVDGAMDLLNNGGETGLGDASICAIAERMLKDGLPKSAEQFAARVRPLSAFAERAWRTRFKAWIAMGAWDKLESFLNALPVLALRTRAMFTLLSAQMGPAEALVQMVEYPTLRPLPLLLVAESISAAGTRWSTDEAFRDASLRVIRESIEAGPTSDERHALEELTAVIGRNAAPKAEAPLSPDR